MVSVMIKRSEYIRLLVMDSKDEQKTALRYTMII